MLNRSPISHLQRTAGGGYQLIVDSRPFLILGAELQNSSFSSAEYMRTIWPKLKEDHINTALVGVYWSMVEPEEGIYDFKEVDQMILDARSQGLKLILLWFGSWKNGEFQTNLGPVLTSAQVCQHTYHLGSNATTSDSREPG